MTTFPAKPCSGETSLNHLPVGGYLRRESALGVMWFFRLPDGSRSKPIEDSVVPCLQGKPEVTLGGWTLSGDVWRRK